MSTTHTTWQGHAEKSNKKERARVAKKYGVTWSDEEQNADPFGDNDSVTDTMGSDRKHKLESYTKASGLPKSKAKKILTETDTLQK